MPKELLNIVTNHTSEEDSMGAIFDHRRQKAKRDKESNEGSDSQPKARRKGDRWQQADILVAMKDQKRRRPSTGEVTDHFKKLLEAPCPYH